MSDFNIWERLGKNPPQGENITGILRQALTELALEAYQAGEADGKAKVKEEAYGAAVEVARQDAYAEAYDEGFDAGYEQALIDHKLECD